MKTFWFYALQCFICWSFMGAASLSDNRHPLLSLVAEVLGFFLLHISYELRDRRVTK
jgi:hypothetical protein